MSFLSKILLSIYYLTVSTKFETASIKKLSDNISDNYNINEAEPVN